MKFKIKQSKIFSGNSLGDRQAATLKLVLDSSFESPNTGTTNVATMGGIQEGMELTLRVEPTLATSPIRETFGITIITNAAFGAASGVWKRSEDSYKVLVDELKHAKMLKADLFVLCEVEGDKLDSTSPLKISQKLIFSGTELVF